MADTASRSMSTWPAHEEHNIQRQEQDEDLYPKRRYNYVNTRAIGSLCTIIIALTVAMYTLVLLASVGIVGGTGLRNTKHSSSSTTPFSSAVPDYFQTTPELYAGPTRTAVIEPFLAQSNPVVFDGPSGYTPNTPLQTNLPIEDVPDGTSIFQLTGHLSSYFPGPGFGVSEYPLPPGSNISQVHVLHRHGSRYPTSESSVQAFGDKIVSLTENRTATWSGSLSFLNTWRYTLGAEILTARGRQELFDSGVLHYFNYGGLYNTSTKIVARTTSQDRMLKSAEYFMAGFFGFEWTQNVSLEVQLERDGFNTSLAGYFQCDNSNNDRSSGGTNASLVWQSIYLQDATARLRKFSGNYDWSISDSYHAQTLCPYETVAYGYSFWCDLFTYQEWQGFEYSIDLSFNGNSGFASPTGRGVGIGFVQEFYARLQGHLYDLEPGATNVNYTLARMDSTFPLNQTMYFDFSHDTNIMSIITAFGLTQFADVLSSTRILENRSMVVSHLTPFGARMVWEVIHSPAPVRSMRPKGTDRPTASFYDAGEATTYIHLLIGQRTVPLYRSYPQCGQRDDGWCDMATFLDILGQTLSTARYEYSCFGNYTVVPYGDITNGVPITKRDMALGLALGGRGSTL